MNCTEARRMVTPYVKHELDDREMEQFLDHVEHCKDCMEELDIYFTMYQALELLESGKHQEYNFSKMLKENIRDTRRRIFRKEGIPGAARCSPLSGRDSPGFYCDYRFRNAAGRD